MTSVPKGPGKPNKPNRSQSERLWELAKGVMPGGVSSPGRAFREVGGTPVFLRRAQGPFVYDADGARYIDLVGSWGSAIAGHAHPRVVEAVQKAAADGLSFGACCAAEATLAQRIIAAFPKGHIEMVRFVSSGTEATMSAVRLARGATGRDKILRFEGCDHGHADALMARDALLAPYNDLEAVARIVKEHGNSLAAVIVEPVATNMGFVRPEPGFLEGLREACTRCGAMLIFDEVTTGFRVALGGYQSTCKVKPDITCLGKVIGGGMPVAAYAGSKELMEKLSPVGSVYQTGTLSGGPVGMAAGIATLNVCAEHGFYDRLGERTKDLAARLKQAADAAAVPVSVDCEGGMLGMSFTATPIKNLADAKAADHALHAKFFHAMLDRGIWLPPSSYEAMFVSSAHTDDLVTAIMAAARDAFREVA